MPHRNDPGIDIIDLSSAKIVQKNFTVLNDVDLHIKKGKFCYLIGKTGSGKSSLLKVLYGQLPLQGGSGQVAGFDLKKLKQSDVPNLRRKLGIVFQDFQLLPDRNIEKNLLFVLQATGWSDKHKMEARIDEVLSSVGMKTKKHKMPHQLSGGEQQRAAIARALLNHPELILADEPTGNLDSNSSKEIMNILKGLHAEGSTVILITHDNSIAEQADRIINIIDGRIEKDHIKGE